MEKELERQITAPIFQFMVRGSFLSRMFTLSNKMRPVPEYALVNALNKI